MSFSGTKVEAGKHHNMVCLICQTQMNVTHIPIKCPPEQRNAKTAYMGLNQAWDRFECIHVNENWHEQATWLKRKIIESQSPTLQEIYFQDLIKVLKSKTVTTKFNNYTDLNQACSV